MTARQQIIALFRKVGARRMGAREILVKLPDFDRSTVIHECLYIAKLGLVSADRVANGPRKKRFEFTASESLLDGWELEGRVSDLVLRAVTMGAGALTVNDVRFTIHTLCSEKLPRSVIENALEELMRGQKLVRAPAGERKGQAYQVGKTRDVPWVLLDGALRGVTLKASAR